MEAAVLRGMAEAKARVAEELRAAANAAAVERGETEIVMVNLADEREEGRKEKEKEDGSSTSEDDGSSTSDGDADAKEKDADDAPEVLSSDGVGCRLGGGTPSLFSGAGAAASGEKSKGERLFERLSAAAEASEETGKDQSLDEAIDAFEDADADVPTRVPTRVPAPNPRREGSSPPPVSIATTARPIPAISTTTPPTRSSISSRRIPTIFLFRSSLDSRAFHPRWRADRRRIRSTGCTWARSGRTDPKCFAWCEGDGATSWARVTIASPPSNSRATPTSRRGRRRFAQRWDRTRAWTRR